MILASSLAIFTLAEMLERSYDNLRADAVVQSVETVCMMVIYEIAAADSWYMHLRKLDSLLKVPIGLCECQTAWSALSSGPSFCSRVTLWRSGF